jgi:putative tryptophan/tyrosine transport system substrate-binding protein
MLIAGAATSAPLSIAAQSPSRVARVGFLGTSPSASRHIFEAFRQGLRDLGYVEGRTVALETRWAESGIDRIPALVAELVRLEVDVLVMANSQAALAAKDATRTIPIVMFAGDPVALGLVTSLARPGGNITGLSYYNTDIIAKRLEFLKELVPGLARVAVLRNPMIAIHSIFWQHAHVAAQNLRLTLEAIEVRSADELEQAFAATLRRNAQAVLVFDDQLTIAHRKKVIALEARSRLPAMYGFREFPDDGGLMSYGANFVALFRRAASYVDKILKGTKPADLPIEQATRFELVVNANTAKALGIAVPPSLLARADEIIE